jgi:hypothetical protein
MEVDVSRSGGRGADSHEDLYTAERRHESEWTLKAIANALAAGRLPPDDAFAWARIAACEARGLPKARPRGAAAL